MATDLDHNLLDSLHLSDDLEATDEGQGGAADTLLGERDELDGGVVEHGSDEGEDADENIDDDTIFAPRARARSQDQSNHEASRSKPRFPPTSPRSDTAALEAELGTLHNINGTLQTVLSSLRTAQSNTHTLHTSIAASTALLDTWTRILGQTEHNQRLILSGRWGGASEDIAAVEREEREQEEAERRRAAELERDRRAREARQARLQLEAEGRGAGDKRRTTGYTGSRAGARTTQRTGASTSTAGTSSVGRGAGYGGVGGQRGIGRGSSATRRPSGVVRGRGRTT
jgi:DASH complex subunit Duo1